MTFVLAQRSSESNAVLNPVELKDAATQDDVTRLRKALADALSLLEKQDNDARAARELIAKLEAELDAANKTLAASKAETQAAEKVIAAADQALTAQSKALEMTERANEKLLLLADRYEARVDKLERRVESANKRGLVLTILGIATGGLLGRRF